MRMMRDQPNGRRRRVALSPLRVFFALLVLGFGVAGAATVASTVRVTKHPCVLEEGKCEHGFVRRNGRNVRYIVRDMSVSIRHRPWWAVVLAVLLGLVGLALAAAMLTWLRRV
jgi:hypothetical protein